MKLVIVESPAKAQTINKYLGNDYKVMASVGHIRDLPSKDGAVLPDENFKMSWEMHKDKEKVVKEIIGELKSAESLILATDPDREGEAISWHLQEILNSRKQFRSSVFVRSIYSEVLNIIQPIVIKKLKNNKNSLNKKYLNDALMTSIAGISAAMKNTG